MKKAVVTGASSGIGQEIAKKLLSLNYKVIGIARDFKKCDIADDNFEIHQNDLSDKKSLHQLLEKLKKEDISILVNSAGFGIISPHEEISVKDIEDMVYLNLTTPLILTKLFLRKIKKNRGHIFNICSISGIKSAPFGAVYGATKAGLRHFGNSLFEESRKSGTKVISINPSITDTSFFKNLHFEPTDDPLSYIKPNCIAEIIEEILNKREGTVITDITIDTQLFKIEKNKSNLTKKT